MKRFRVVFMGTPEFAVPCLSMLAQQTELLAVVTQPDKPRGRGQKLVPSPVKARGPERSACPCCSRQG
jgi:methionyl-tRNA formyltransferase